VKIARTPARRAGLVATAVGLVAGVVVVAPKAQAEQPATASPPAAAADPLTVVSTLSARLGGNTAGSYVDQAGKVVVTVTDASAEQAVRDAGATPKRVTRSLAALTGVTGALDRTARIPGTSWSIDPATNQVVVQVDSTVTGAKLARMRAAAAKLGGAVRIEQFAGTFTLHARGGEAIFAGGARCSLGFNVRRGDEAFFVTAGHCGRPGTRWSERPGGRPIGQTVESRFPRDDFALVRYTAEVSDQQGSVRGSNGVQDITRAADPVVGQRVQRSGSTTGVHSGVVTGLNATVNYPQGTVRGLIATTVCAEPGDSGGSLFSGSTALGLTSGGSGNCRSRGRTFFQPVTEALRAFQVDVF
jgi:Alpha-lytic protease prodomain/Trypsin